MILVRVVVVVLNKEMLILVIMARVVMAVVVMMTVVVKVVTVTAEVWIKIIQRVMIMVRLMVVLICRL